MVKPPDGIREIVQRALHEDVGSGDITTLTFVSRSRLAGATIVARSEGVLCGIDVAREVFRQVDPSAKFQVRVRDGQKVRSGVVCARISGRARALLTAERTALNFIQHLSGIATLTHHFVARTRRTRAAIYDTRKTTPGLRALEKYAVRCGGGRNHRMGLFDAVLVKENHLALGGLELSAALGERRRKNRWPVEVEAQSMEEVRKLVALPVDIVLLDNFAPSQLRRAVKFLRRVRRNIVLEASGGVNLKTVRAVAATGVDRVSIGALTHSAPALDFSMDVVPR